MQFQVWISKKTDNGSQSNELGFFTPEQCKTEYQNWVDQAKDGGFEQLVLNPIGFGTKLTKKLVIKL